MTLMAALQLLLHRYSGQEDIAVGTPIAGRNRSELEGLMGMFVNTLVIRSDLSGNPSFRELLGQVRDTSLEAHAHQDLPFEKLVEELQPQRDLSRNPLFQVMLAWQHPVEAHQITPDLKARALKLGGGISIFDLALSAWESVEAGDEGGIEGAWDYSTDLFDGATIERMQRHFEVLLEEIVANPDAPVGDLALMDEEERRVLVEEWAGTVLDVSEGECIHHLFEARVDEDPDRVAVVAEDGSLTYGELESRANRLARHLVELGVEAETLVGVSLPRTTDMVVAVMGILKAGAAYLPLDPDLPSKRLEYMLDDGRAAVLVTNSAGLKSFPAFEGEVVCVDRDRRALGSLSDTRLDIEVDPARLAYVLYTSGSTGRPKGVEVCHQNVVDYLHSISDWPGLSADDVILAVATLSFDVSVLEFFGSLGTGARIVLAPWETVRDGPRLRALAEETGVNLTNSTPATLYMLLDAGWRGNERMRVWTGSEAVPLDLVRKLMVGCGEVWNLYGPTETTVTATAWKVPDGVDDMRIGTPLGNYQVYVLDPRMQPVPVGIPGELYIGGVGVARGYRNRPELTAEQFIPDPFGGKPGARLYRSGDRVRFRNDGTLEFMGRLDNQVKIRGLRIELGEIESVLVEQEAVRQVAVLVHGEGVDARLVAYVVFEEGGRFNLREMRGILRQYLPDYMVPSLLIELDELPLTPSGKVHRKALPDPETSLSREGEAFVAPRTPTEEALAGIWAEVLGQERVGAQDDFFELGGHSLLATQVMSRVARDMGVKLALRSLFESPTLEELAERIEAAGPGASASPPPIERVSREEPAPLSFAQQRLWFLDQLGNAGRAYHIPMCVRLLGELDRVALGRALDRIVARHEALRTTFEERESGPVQRIAEEESGLGLLDHDLLGHPEADAELRRLIATEATAGFDLDQGPLIRGRLIRLAPNDHVMLLTLHHIVSDGWSMGVLVNELNVLYGAFQRGEADPLPELEVQYLDYSVWQREWVGGETLRQQADYWTQALAGVPELLALPTDHPRPAAQDHAGAMAGLELGEELVAGLRALSMRHGATLFMTLLAGWATVLSRLSGQEDLVIGIPTANRGRTEIEGLIGFFVNTLALRIDLSGSPTVAELLKRVKSQALAAQHHQDIPFEQVVELVQPARSLAHSPLFQVMLAWQNTGRVELELPGLTLGSVEAAERVTALFDLLLSLTERDGRIVGGVEYATALFERATVERYLGHFRMVLEGMVADEDQSVDRLRMMSDAERRQVVHEWNATDAAYPSGSCIHELIEAQVDRTPDAVAVVYEGDRLTYGELNTRANRLAHHLRDLGVGPDAGVAICLERSLELMVGLLGVLKAGGAYVPLDPSYPAERLRYMLEDSEAVALLTQGSLAGLFGELREDMPVIDLFADAGSWADQPETNPDGASLGLCPDHLAYVMYTSGSTGRPKGVMLEHRSVVNRIVWMQEEYAIDPSEALLQKTTVSFDVSVWEFFWPVMVGARLVMARPEGHKDPGYLIETINREEITRVHFVPSMLQLFLDHPDAGTCSGLVLVACSGEALPAPLVDRFYQRLPEVGLCNWYGPTEGGEVTDWRCTPEEVEGSIPIGRPISNTRIYILDAQGEPVPVGVTGEIFIGGVALARGYQNLPELTAERFVPDPFSGEEGGRLYRTGDLGRWRPDGAIEFLGRNDFQVKVRGFRIELGEIEAQLGEYPAVRAAAVLAREDTPGDQRLVAYYVGAEPVEVEVLRTHLAERLPEYMIPAAFVHLDALPLTPSGKVDRKALPVPGGDAYLTRSYEAPEGDVEKALAGIWAEVLGRDRVGVHDDFFGLGGHSLLATQVMSRVARDMDVELPLRTLFESPTVAELAVRIDARRYVASAQRLSDGGPLEEEEI
jgi:amino acid adenylation domain-containing protein